MTDIIRTTQLQDPGSSLITLYELEYSTGSFAYFYSGRAEFDGTTLENVRFREWRQEFVVGAEIEYVGIPIEAEGFDTSNDGAISRPTLTIANIGSVLSDSIGGLKPEELIGTKLTKRTTLEKYLVGGSGDVGPGLAPVEYPRTVYYIDRVKEKNIVNITFELAAPFDLQGVTVPRRVVIGGACPFKYKGAQQLVSPQARLGGCDWDSTFQSPSSSSVLFINELDEYVISDTNLGQFSAWSGSSTKNSLYTTTSTADRYSADGLSTSPVTVTNYWQAITTGTGTPSDSDRGNWRRIRLYSIYSAGTTYYGYKQSGYNDYVKKLLGDLFKVKLITVDTSVNDNLKEGRYWTLGDVCGKKINSCTLRYNALELPVGSGIPDSNLNKTNHLRFGGFPGVQQRR